MNYYITTFCHGQKYQPIVNHWIKNNENKCPTSKSVIFGVNQQSRLSRFDKPDRYAFWDVLRMEQNIELLRQTQKTVVQCDLDVIIKKDLEPLIKLDYDITISKEIGGNKSFPPECSKKLGFGVCTGFVIMKPSGLSFLENIFNKMTNYTYDSYSDQVSIMNYITNHPNKTVFIPTTETQGHIIEIDNIRILVLDFDLVTRDPVFDTPEQYALHINIDNVGGTDNFIKYFYDPLSKLPLTCRCGKTWLGDNNECPHIKIKHQL